MENNKNIWSVLLDLALSLIQKNVPNAVQAPVAAAVPESAPKDSVPAPAPPSVVSGIDWLNPASKVSDRFTVRELIWLPSWNRLANEADGLNDEVKNNLVDLAHAMDKVREKFGHPIRVHVTYRPVEYNKQIGGALHSAHSEGKAMDFDVVSMTCDAVRDQLVAEKLLEAWEMRCENALGTNWVHLDRRALLPNGHRFFKP